LQEHEHDPGNGVEAISATANSQTVEPTFPNTLPHYGEESALEPIALTAAMVMPVLLLQKPHPSSKSQDHVACLHRRLDSWKTGDINNLMIEGRTIQHRLKQGQDHRELIERRGLHAFLPS